MAKTSTPGTLPPLLKPSMLRVISGRVLLGSLFIAGCSQALPNQDLRTVGEQTRIVASTYATETKKNVEAAEEKLARAEQLLREARELYSRAEAAEKRCAERAAKLQKLKPAVITRCPQPTPVPEAGPGVAASSSGAAASSSGTPAVQPTAAPTSPSTDPDYSPSDAPL